MRNAPLVSVIIPTYKGAEESLSRAIDSVLNQTYQNIEVIVVDDNDPGTEERRRTEMIMERYSDNNRVLYVKHERNRNAAAARNTGFDNCNGDYICFLDDDDIFEPTKVAHQVAYLEEHPEYDAVYCGRFQDGKTITYSKTGDLSEEILCMSFTPCTSSIMIRRDPYIILGGFDEQYRRHQDFEFLLRFFERFSIGAIELPLFTVKGNGIDNALHGKDLEELKFHFLNQFMPHIEKIEMKRPGFKKLVLARHYSALFWDCMKRMKIYIAGRTLVKYSLVCGPVFWSCLFAYLRDWVSINTYRLMSLDRKRGSVKNLV